MSPLLAMMLVARQTGPISFSTPGVPFVQVCERLAKQTGLAIVPGGDLKEEVVAVDIREMSGKELVDHLAHVLYAKATFRDGKWVLAPDPAAVAERVSNALKMRIEDIKRAQAAVLAQVESGGAFDPSELLKRLSEYHSLYEGQKGNVNPGKSYAAFDKIRRDGPGRRAVRRLISQLPADVLAHMPGGDVLVFSDQPRRYQARLGEEARECIAEAAAEQNAWASAYQPDGTLETRWWYGGDPRYATDRIDPSKVRLFLKATMDEESKLPRFEASLATADGIVLLNVSADMEMDAKPAPPAPASPADTEKAISLSPLATEQVVAYRKGPHTPVEGAKGEARKWILNPEKYEPLGGAVSEALMTSARAKHKNLVACIPDEAFNLMYTFGGDNGDMWPYKPSGVLAAIGKMSAQVEESATCIDIRGNGTDARTDRASLGRLIRQEDEDNCLRLLPLVQFAGLLRSNDWNTVAWQAVDPIVPSSLEAAEIPEWLPLRLLGHLGPEQLAALVAGRSLRVETLPEYVREGIEHAVYFRPAENLDFPYRPNRNAGRHSTLDREPTEFLPDGFARDATVSLSSTTSLVIGAVSSNQSVTPVSVRDFAAHMLAQQYDQYQGRDRLRGQATPTVHLGRQTHYTLQWHLAPGLSMSHHLTDNDFNLRSAPIAAGALPDEYQKQLAAETSAIQKEGNVFFSRPGVNNPPPP